MSTISKLAEVMKAVGYLQKDANIGGKYNALSEEKVTGVVNPEFSRLGLLIWPTYSEIVERWTDTTANSVMNHVVVKNTYHCTDGTDDGINVEAHGEGRHNADKAVPMAMTIAFKYALRQLLMISTGDDPDHIYGEDTKTTSTTKEPAPASAAGARPRGNLDWRLELFGRLGWTELKEDGTTGPSKDAFYFLRKQDVPKSWREWTTADCDKVRVALLEEISLHQPAPTLPDISDLEDPFREQG